MRLILVIILTFFTLNTFSINYYFSSSTGNDSYSNIQAQNRNTPWNTIDKLNASMHLFAPGDSILFKRGDTFTGQIVLDCSGTSNNKIVFSAYGTGLSPVISGTRLISGWNYTNGNVWVADCPYLDNVVTNFFINGISQQIGRFPNADAQNGGFLNIESHIGKTSLSNASLAAMTDWTGGDVVVRTRRWMFDLRKVQTHSGNSLNLSSPTTFEMYNNYGFFLQNHIGTLDKTGEWYYDIINKKMYLYQTINPNSLITEATLYSSLFEAVSRRYFTIENLEFRGSLGTSISLKNSDNFEFNNNTITNSGINSLQLIACTNISINGNKILNTNNTAIVTQECKDVTVQDNEILNTGLRPGMGNISDIRFTGIFLEGDNIQCSYNRIENVGYIGINFHGDAIAISNNQISHFCLIIDDGGGIYTSSDERTINSDRTIEKNIILDGIGAPAGTDNQLEGNAQGIYLDDRSNHVIISENTVASCSGYGIFIHNSNNFSILGNNIFNNKNQLGFSHDNIAPNFPIRNGIIKNNIFFSKKISQFVANFRTIKNDISSFGTFESNFYCRPLFDDQTLRVEYATESGPVAKLLDLKTWQKTYGYDLLSGISPFKLPAYELVDLIDSNKYSNGTFNINSTGWYFWSNYSNGSAIWVNSGNLDNGCIKLGFNNPSGKQDSYISMVGNINEMNKGENYILRFSMISSSPEKKVSINLRKGSYPYNDIATSQYVFVNPTRNEYELLFTPNVSEPKASINFKIEEDDKYVWIDNVALHHADVRISASEESIKLFYNNSKSVKVFNDNNFYIDVNGNPYRNFSLQPFSSIVLIQVTEEYFNRLSNVIKATSISVTSQNGLNNISEENGTLQLFATINPDNVTNKAITWSVQNGTGQASIDAGGLLTARSNGTVTVIAASSDGSGVSGNYTVTISGQTILVSGIVVTGTGNISSISSNKGTLQLIADVSPVTAANKAVTWSIQNGTGQATINSAGLVSAMSNGTITATATASDGSENKGSLLITITGQEVPVTGISITGAGGLSVITANKGSLQLTANFLPTYATTKTVTWSIQNSAGQATINNTGLVTAISNGTVTVTATATDGSGVKGNIIITISGQNVAVAGITVSGTNGVSTIISDKGTLQLFATVSPSAATNKLVTWSIQNGTGQASISSTGLVSAVSNGTATATATATDGSGIKGSMTITISGQAIAVTRITIQGSGGKSTINSVGETLQLYANVFPTDATNKTVNWSIQQGTGQASISSSGLVTAIVNGTVTAIASATDDSGVKGSLIITISTSIVMVSAITVYSDDFVNSVSGIGDKLQLYASVFPGSAHNHAVSWTVTNGTGQATINEKGLLTALSYGQVTVVAKARDGSGVTGTLIVHISEQITGIAETEEKPYLLKNEGSTLSIQFKEPSGFKQIYLYNLSGNLLFADKIYNNPMIIDITSLLQGIYIVQLIDISGKKEAIKFYK